MARLSASMPTTTRPGSSSLPDTHLQGYRLIIARVIWAILVILTLGLFTAMLPAYFTQLQTVCTDRVCAPTQPAIDTAQALQAHSLTIAGYAIFTFIFMLVIALACCIVGAVIFWRRSDDWMALLVALVLTMVGNVYVTYPLQQSHSAWQWPAFILNTTIFTIIFLFFSLFPDGRFVPRWSHWITVAWIGWGVIFLFIFHLPFSIMLDDLVWLCLYGCSVVAQIFRYRSLSHSVQRQQTKWIVFGMCLTMIAVVGLRVPAIIFPSLGPGSLYDLASTPGLMLAMIPFPLSIGFAVMRSRLWDIDIIINRTLVYALLTALLALVYFGSVALLQYLFRAFIGQASPLAVIGSTLAIAALFHPLRKYIQTIIDSCFYRRKYNAQQVLADFDAKVRSWLYSCDEEGLGILASNVQEIVEETLQPSHISLWLSAPELAKEAGEGANEVLHVSKETSIHVWEDREESNSFLRDRLWDIDVLVNRVLIYGTLVAVFGLASLCILMIQQRLAQVVPAQISELFIVGSVLAVVTCFKTMRWRIQSFIDRHFFQHKYQAEQTLDGFTATLRQEVNLPQLSEGLLEAVSEAMESERISLWINMADPESKILHYTGVLRQ